jgi:hypothetical protein
MDAHGPKSDAIHVEKDPGSFQFAAEIVVDDKYIATHEKERL